MQKEDGNAWSTLTSQQFAAISLDQLAHNSANLPETRIASEYQSWVWDAVLAMPPERREVLTLVLLDLYFGKKVNSSRLAKTLGISRPAFYRRFGEALCHLGEALRLNPQVQKWLSEKNGDLPQPTLTKDFAATVSCAQGAYPQYTEEEIESFMQLPASGPGLKLGEFIDEFKRMIEERHL